MSCNRSTEPKQYPSFILDYPHRTQLNTVFGAADSLKYAFDIVSAARRFEAIYTNGALSTAPDSNYCLNQLVYLYATMGQWERAMDWMNTFNTRRLSATGIDVDAKGDFYYNQGLIANYKNQPRFARDCFFKALECYKSTYAPAKGHLKIATAENTIGLWYSEFMLDSAYQFVQDASKHFKVIKDTPYDYLTKENELAQAKTCYFDRAYKDSEGHCKQAIQLAEQTPFKDSAFIAECYFNASISAFDSDLLTTRETYIAKGLKLITNNTNPKYHQLYFYAQGEYLTITMEQKDFKTAQDSINIIKCFDDNMKLASKYQEKHPARYVFPELLVANFYRYGLGDAYKAKASYLQALDKYEHDTLCSAYQMEMLWHGITSVYRDLEEFDQALVYAKRYILFNSALSDRKAQDISWAELMQPDQLGLKNYLYVPYRIAGKIFLKKYYKYHRLSDLKQAYELFKLIHNLLDKSILSQTEQAINRIVQLEAGDIYSMAVESVYELHKQQPRNSDYQEMAFRFMEKQKAYLLNNKMEQKRDSLLAENLRPAKAKIRNMYTRLDQLKNNGQEGRYDTLSIELTGLIDSLSKTYPEIASFKPYEYNLTDVQKKLKDNESILEYFVGDMFTYAMLFKKDTVIFKQIAITDTLVSYIDSLTKHFKLKNKNATFTNLLSYKNYIRDAKLVSKLLFSSVYSYKDTFSRILIIPDKQVNLVNFEALFMEENILDAQKLSEVKYHKLPYLIRRHLIVYSPSIRIHALNSGTPQLPLHPNLLALVSPDFEHQFDSIEESYTNSTVTRKLINNKTEFFEAINPQHIICIMSHGSGASDDKDNYNNTSKLYFGAKEDSSSQVDGSSIQHLQLPASLVILTSCEGALGPDKDSEIAYTLSWYFLRAGAGTIISSYSTIHPKFSNKILMPFFKFLNAQKEPAAALRAAKIEYLDKNYNGENGYEPYYWASLICFE
jgi:CHAT domain-containing protein